MFTIHPITSNEWQQIVAHTAVQKQWRLKPTDDAKSFASRVEGIKLIGPDNVLYVLNKGDPYAQDWFLLWLD